MKHVTKQITKARFATILSLALLSGPATAQVYNPNTPTAPAPILPATPPQAQPGMAAPPAIIGESSRTTQSRLPPSISTGRPSRETHNDRSIRCAHQAGAGGVPAGANGRYVGECVTN